MSAVVMIFLFITVYIINQKPHSYSRTGFVDILFHLESLHKLSGVISCNIIRMIHKLSMERNSSLNSFYHKLIQRSLHLSNRFFSSLSSRNKLRYHRIIVRRNHITVIDMRSEEHTSELQSREN